MTSSVIAPFSQLLVVNGMTCEACVYKVQYVLGQIDGVNKVDIDLKTGKTILEVDRNISFDEIATAMKPHTKYNLVDATKIEESKPMTPTFGIINPEDSWFKTYYPLLLIITFITGIAFSTAYQQSPSNWVLMGLHNFMAGFFLAFSFFKLLNIKAFAESFAMYDLLAMRWPVYGRIYPFIELGLGIACLWHFAPRLTYITDIALMGFGALGVIKSVLDQKQIRCACLGTVFNLPMSTVTIIENTVMVVVGIALLVLT
jgi:copper chaperone CopZ